jgi:oxalate decarboxylase/phosphoglucose isomerase-like protein (cupin superfamily)
MKVDLSRAAGFPLTFDPSTGELGGDGPIQFGRVARRHAEMVRVLFEPDGVAPTTELYWTLPLIEAGTATTLLEQTGLTYSCVLLPPLKIGREYVKTQGHYHPAMPSSDISYPEVYTHLWGEPSLLLQRRRVDHDDQIDDCALVELRDGVSVTIPPGYAHILINVSPQPALIAGLYSTAFAPIYDPIVRLGGAAYFLIDTNDGVCATANPRYDDLPPLDRLIDLEGTRFAAPDVSRALWTSFLADPTRYSFLANADAARELFGSEADAR